MIFGGKYEDEPMCRAVKLLWLLAIIAIVGVIYGVFYGT